MCFLKIFGPPKGAGSAPIVPEGDIRSFALAAVIAIMTFLAGMALGGANLIQASARSWQSQVSHEATVQIMPAAGLDMEKALKEAITIARSFGGVAAARIVSRSETEQLLAPWLGSGFDMDELPVPRLVIVTLQHGARPDFDGLREALQQNVPSARFDDHQLWIDRFVFMAHGLVAGGVLVFLLVLAAMIVTVVFATRGALSSNRHIIEVLHFIGADSGFIARQFDGCFFRIGLKGALAGGICAILLFVLASFWLSYNMTTLQGSQMLILFGNFSAGWINLAEILVLILFVSLLTMLTSRYTVIRQLRHMDEQDSDFFSRSG